MNRLILVFMCCIASAMQAYNYKSFFEKVSINEIGSLSVAPLTYDTIIMDHHFPNDAIYIVPNYKFTPKSDVLKDIDIIILGDVYFMKTNKGTYDSAVLESIGIHAVVLKGTEGETIYLTSPNELNRQTKTKSFYWLLNDVKKDFLKRMKHSIFKVNRTDAHGVSVGWGYKISIGKSQNIISYDLHGRHADGQPTSGIYIQNGRKHAVK